MNSLFVRCFARGRNTSLIWSRAIGLSRCSRSFVLLFLAVFLAQGCDHDKLKDPALPGNHSVVSWEYKPDPANPGDPL